MTPGSTLECLPEQRVLAPILVVDDDPAILDTVAQILDLEGYPAVTAADGAEALEEIERRRPSLVLLDMRMPVMDGWAFAAELAARGVEVSRCRSSS